MDRFTREYLPSSAAADVIEANDRTIEQQLASVRFTSVDIPYNPTVTVDNFGTPGITDYRNPHLAEALHNLGFVQRFGVGISLARKSLADNGNRPPEFSVHPNHVLVTVRANS
jgi:hypothetical protein